VTTTPAQQQLAAQKVVEAQKEVSPPTPPPPKPATAGDLSPIVEAYAQAIESKSIGQLRRIYPGMPATQQRGWQDFFQRARNIKCAFRVEDLSSTTTSADATLAGRCDYSDSDKDNQRLDVSFAASFQREGNAWKLVALR